jgi:hypothetical protein
MINKKLSDIGSDDIKLLISNAVQEGRTIEYKSQIYSNTDADRKELLADVSSFANKDGGDLLIGVVEEKGIAIECDGICLDNADKFIQQLDNIIQAGLEPRINYNIVPVKMSEDRFVIVIRIMRSWNGPHRVVFKKHDKFYSRTSSGKYPLDTFDLRAAFTYAQQIEDKINRFRTERIFSISANETPISIGEGAKIILHLIPLDAMSGHNDYNVRIEETGSGLFTLWDSFKNHRINFDGLLTYSETRKGKSYVQFYRNGILESVDTSILAHHHDDFLIPGLGFENKIIDALKNHLVFYSEQNITLPILLFISLVGIEGYTVWNSKTSPFTTNNRIDKENLLLPGVLIENYSRKAENILKPCFDLIWNASGYSGSMYYDESGNRNT